jgi:hypothetical protein
MNASCGEEQKRGMKSRLVAKASLWALTVSMACGVAAQQLSAPPNESANASSTICRDAVEGSVVSGILRAPSGASASLNYTLATAPKHGMVAFADKTKGEWVYKPAASFVGYDEFRVNVGDGQSSRSMRIVVSMNYQPTFRTYYVDAARGSDRNPGNDRKPFATIQAAHDVTMPGDTVLIHDGTYRQTSAEAVLLVTRSGLPGAMITYKAYPGEHPVLHAETAWNHILIEASYIRIEGLEIAGNARNVSQVEAEKLSEKFMQGPASQSFGPETSAYETNGIIIRPADQKASLDRQITPRHIEVLGNRIHDVQGGGLSSLFADHLLFAKNVIYDTSYRTMYATSGISILGSQNTDDDRSDYTMVVRDNLLYRNRTEVKWAAIKAMSDGNGIIIDSNRNDDPKGEPYLGRMLIANNIVYESGGAGIQVFASDNVDVLHNTVVRNSLTPGFQYAQLWVHKASNVRLENNIAVAGDGELINEAFKDTTNVDYDYNLYYGGKQPEIIGPHDILADPRFADEKAANFHLLPDSPALNSGNATLTVARDFVGTPRPAKGPVDRGALQHYRSNSR